MTSSGSVCLKAILDKIRSNSVEWSELQALEGPEDCSIGGQFGCGSGHPALVPVARQLLARPGRR